MAENATKIADLTPQQECFCLLYAQGDGVPALAVTLRVSQSTLYRWLRAAAVRARVRELRAEMMSSALGRLAARVERAVSRLFQLMESKDERVALAAVRTHHEHLTRLEDREQFEARLRALEERVGVGPEGGRGPGG